MSKIAGNISRTVVQKGRFLQLENIEFIDERGRTRNWEAAGRVNSQGAVGIIGRLLPSNRILLVRQYRPPAGKYVIEFPAGLIDPQEEAAATARRELYEETGYTGMLSFCSPGAYGSVGMSGETIAMAIVEINDFEFPSAPEPHLEDGECIEIFAVEVAGLRDFIDEAIAAGDGIDVKLLIFMMAQEFFHA